MKVLSDLEVGHVSGSSFKFIFGHYKHGHGSSGCKPVPKPCKPVPKPCKPVPNPGNPSHPSNGGGIGSN